MSESLRSLSDHEVLTRTHALTVQERKLTLGVLLHLNEIERRELHLKRGYPSMFVYCTTALGYSESAANRRIKTARCIAQFPQVHDLLRTGQVNLSTVSQVSKILKPENSGAVLARIRGKSQREVDDVIAEYDPRAALPPDRVRTVVIPVTASSPIREMAPLLNAAHTDEYRRSGGKEFASAQIGDRDDTELVLPRPAVPVPMERHAMIQFSAREAFMAKMGRVRSLSSHRLPGNASLEQVFNLLMDYFIEREDPAERHARRELRAQTQAETPAPRKAPRADNSRQMPARVRDQVFVRDRQQCSYVGVNGQRCGSTHVLQVDHIRPVARGGASTVDNLRLLCAFHNRFEAERLMGPIGRPPR